VSHVSDITLGEGAELTWIIVQQQGADDTHLGQIRVDLGADAKLKLFVINAGGKLVRQELHINVTGEGADLTLRGINLLGAETPYRCDDGARPQRAEHRLDGDHPQRGVRPRQGRVPGHDPGGARCAEDRRQDGVQHAFCPTTPSSR
jgi:hypothetical protein